MSPQLLALVAPVAACQEDGLLFRPLLKYMCGTVNRQELQNILIKNYSLNTLKIVVAAF